MPTHQRSDLLEVVLPPMLADPATLEVIVAADWEDPATEAVLRRLARGNSQLSWFTIKPSVGAARARLRAAHNARGEILVLLDDDVRPVPGLVSRHETWHDGGSRRLVVGYMPVALPRDRTLVGVAARLYQRHYETAMDAYREHPGQVLAGLWGGNVSLARADYLALEPDLLRYPRLAHEDKHLGLCALAAGLVGVFDEQARAEHLHRRTWQGMLDESHRQGRGQRVLAALHPDAAGPFDADEVPQGLNPAVGWMVRHSDRRLVREVELGALGLLASVTSLVGAARTADRSASAAGQIARRAGRRDASVPMDGGPQPRSDPAAAS